MEKGKGEIKPQNERPPQELRKRLLPMKARRVGLMRWYQQQQKKKDVAEQGWSLGGRKQPRQTRRRLEAEAMMDWDCRSGCPVLGEHRGVP